jgi:integrase
MLQLCLLLAREAGLRHATILNFAAKNCNFETGMVSGRSKAYSSYTIPMTDRLRDRLLFACAAANDQNEPLLCQYNRHRRKPAYKTMSTQLATTKKRAGVTAPWAFHDLRRTAARALYQRTGDIRKVQRFLGHASIQQSWWYLGNETIELSAADLQSQRTPEPKEERKIA